MKPVQRVCSLLFVLRVCSSLFRIRLYPPEFKGSSTRLKRSGCTGVHSVGWGLRHKAILRPRPELMTTEANPPRCVHLGLQCTDILLVGKPGELKCAKAGRFESGPHTYRGSTPDPHPPHAPSGMIEPTPPKSSCPGLLVVRRSPSPVSPSPHHRPSLPARRRAAHLLTLPPRSRHPLPLPLALPLPLPPPYHPRAWRWAARGRPSVQFESRFGVFRSCVCALYFSAYPLQNKGSSTRLFKYEQLLRSKHTVD